MALSVSKIEGIGAAKAAKLAKAKIRTVESLLKMCCDKKGRKAVAKDIGFSESTLLKWANMADLMRINGVGEEYSELLEAAGVDTVKELAKRRTDNLTEAMEKANKRRKLVRRTPSEVVVKKWVAHAKRLKPRVTH